MNATPLAHEISLVELFQVEFHHHNLSSTRVEIRVETTDRKIFEGEVLRKAFSAYEGAMHSAHHRIEGFSQSPIVGMTISSRRGGLRIDFSTDFPFEYEELNKPAFQHQY